jgi:hypothetical protein
MTVLRRSVSLLPIARCAQCGQVVSARAMECTGCGLVRYDERILALALFLLLAGLFGA